MSEPLSLLSGPHRNSEIYKYNTYRVEVGRTENKTKTKTTQHRNQLLGDGRTNADKDILYFLTPVHQFRIPLRQ